MKSACLMFGLKESEMAALIEVVIFIVTVVAVSMICVCPQFFCSRSRCYRSEDDEDLELDAYIGMYEMLRFL